MKPIALILGGTGSIGLACVEALAINEYDFVIVHRDKKSMMKELGSRFDAIRNIGASVTTFNLNINEAATLDKLSEFLQSEGQYRVSLFIHAVADANIGKLFGEDNILDKESFVHTLSSMSISFVTWAQMLVNNNVLRNGGRIIGFTSEGSNKIIDEYIAVGMAKAALEASCRYMAIELASKKITVNLINAGVIDSRALKAFSYYEKFIDEMKKRNPSGSLTTPEDVAKVVVFLSSDAAAKITGEIIRVDGGEQVLL